jgi:putative membrane protein
MMLAAGEGGRIWLPYCGPAPVPAELAGEWNLDPVLLAGIAALVAAWLAAARRGEGRYRAGPFAGFIAVLLVLFVSPFCALTAALFAARAAHHAALVAVAAPLLALSLPRELLKGLLPIGGWVVAGALVLWGWHAPSLYAAALSNDLVYWLMQASLLTSATGFWLAARQAAMPAAVAALLATMVQMGLLGAILTFSAAPFYAPHFLSTAPWGYTPLEDQQLAGLIMWAPAAALYLAAALFVAGRWIGRESAAAA